MRESITGRLAVSFDAKACKNAARVAGVLFFLVAAGGIVVEGTTDCPDAAGVRDRATDLLPRESSRSGADRVVLSREGGELEIDLRSADGTPLASRRIAAIGTCEELREASAVIIATWETELHPVKLSAPVMEK